MQVAYDVIIIGAGAAGLMCAIEAGKRGRRVLILDHAKKVGEKIRISGGGRCNFTNIHATPANFLSQNPRFAISALKRFTPQDFIALVKKHQIAYHEKTLGQLFCDGSSQQIIDMLLDECEAVGVEIWLNVHIEQIFQGDGSLAPNPPPLCVRLRSDSAAEPIECASLVIATGGKSIPKMGATGFGYEVAEQFGIPIIPPTAALVPISFENPMLDYVNSLAGVALEVVASCNKTSFREGMLFTHRGLSGPAILQISSYWKKGDIITVNLAPDTDILALLKQEKQANNKQDISTILSRRLPKRLAQRIVEDHHCTSKLADTADAKLRTLADAINRWQIKPDGTEGFRTAEVTLGGVDTNALSSQTMAAKSLPNLYFIGEVVDVTGHLGGFNFQWAWASGYAAGQYV